MLLLFFLACGVGSKAAAGEQDAVIIDPEAGNGDFKEFSRIRPNTKHCYATWYTGEAPGEHLFIQTLVLGYQLYKFDPETDRVLLIPHRQNMSLMDMAKLRSIFTHVVECPFIEFKCGLKEKEHPYFKLNAWNLLKYEKVLILGGTILLRRSLRDLFEFSPPLAAPDYQLWALTPLGATLNTDFLMISPKSGDFDNLVELGCNFSSRPPILEKKLDTLGEHENGLISEFYLGNISTLPWWWHFELPGNEIFTNNNLTKYDEPIIASLRFPKRLRPWRADLGNPTTEWVSFAEETYLVFNENINPALFAYSMKRPFATAAPILTDFVSFYTEFTQSTKRQVVARSLLIFITTGCLLGLSLCSK